MTSEILQGHGSSHNARVGGSGGDPIPDLDQALRDIDTAEATIVTNTSNIATNTTNITTLQGQVPLTGRVTSDYVHPQSNTTLADVTGLTVSLAASTVYQFTVMVMYHSGTTPDFKWSLVGPSGATGTVWANYFVAGSYVSFKSYVGSLTSVASDGTGLGYANAQMILLQGICITTNAGSLKIQGAQNTSDASDTTVMAGSSITAVKIA